MWTTHGWKHACPSGPRPRCPGLDAIARALLVDDHEREHLDQLADAARHSPQAAFCPQPKELTDEPHNLVRAVDGIPAIVLGLRTGVPT
ncbi:hypothetical protein ACFVYD_34385 [Streptomyces sp. NPDC058301]|uniref:hypothetical protein n=1 Tax=Streptomyces sp. NPDC058301 TaxID=3346436 RepID=UPI0036F0A031